MLCQYLRAFREAIEPGLRCGRNAMAIWQDLATDGGYRGGYQSVKRFVRRLRGNQPVRAGAVILTLPEEAQVDYDTGPVVRAIRRRASMAAPGCLS